MKLITVLPDVVKSPKLTADWENALSLVARGEYSMQAFMEGIEDMVRNMVQKYDAYLIPEGIEDFAYTKDGKEIKGTQYKFKMEFPQRK